MEKGGLVSILKGAEECFIPITKEHTDVNHSERESDHDDEQPPRRQAVL